MASNRIWPPDLQAADNLPSVHNATDGPRWLTPEQTMALLGIGRTLFYSLVRDGSIPTIRLGRLIRVPYAPLLSKYGGECQAADGSIPKPSATFDTGEGVTK